MIKKVLKYTGITAAGIIGLFLLLAITLYIPPVQNFIVHRVTGYASEKLDMQLRVGRIRLAFPLDLALNDAFARQRGDTLLDARCVRVNVALLPLLSGRIDIDGLEIYHSKINTLGLISDTQIRGNVGRLLIRSHGIDIPHSAVSVESLSLRDADVSVLLSDTARKDTTKKSPSLWKIRTGELSVSNTKVRVRMPGDSMRIAAAIESMRVSGGSFDIFRSVYAVRKIRLRAAALSYDIPYEAAVTSGIDPSHIAMSAFSTEIDSLLYASSAVRAAIKGLTFRERSGLELRGLSGHLYADSTRVEMDGLKVHTPYSTLSATGIFPFSALKKSNRITLKLRVEGKVDRRDILAAVPGGLPGSVRQFIPTAPIGISATVSGSRGDLHISGGKVTVPGMLSLSVDGTLRSLSARASGNLRYSLITRNISPLMKAAGLGPGSGISLPYGTSARGRIAFTPSRVATRSYFSLGRGSATASGYYDMRSSAYSLRLNTSALPLGNIIRGSGLHSLTAAISANGRGFNPFARSTMIRAKAGIRHFGVSSIDLSGLKLTAALSGGKGTVTFSSTNKLLSGSGTVSASFTRRNVAGTLSASLSSLDLQKLSGGDKPARLSTRTRMAFYADSKLTSYGLDGSVDSIFFHLDSGRNVRAKDLMLKLDNHRDSLYARLSAGDLFLLAHSRSNIDRISSRISRFASLITHQLKRRRLDQDALRSTLPQLYLTMEAGNDNPLSNWLKYRQGYSLSRLHLDLTSSAASGLEGKGYIYSFDTGSLLLDTTRLTLYHDSTGLRLSADVRNATKHNPYIFTASLNASLLNDGIDAGIVYRDRKGKKGIDLGLRTLLTDSGTSLRIYPEHPVIAYRRFTINKDNYITLLNDKSILADIDLLADDNTGLKIYGDRTDSLSDITVSVNRLNLGELTSSIPYAPLITGLLSGDVHVTRQQSALTAAYDLNVKDMGYGGAQLGNIGAVGTYMPVPSEEAHFIDATLSSEGRDVANIEGTYHGRTDSLNASLGLLAFPASLLNGFTGETLSLGGTLGGNLALTGTASRPVVNGKVLLDSIRLYSDVYGFNMLMANDSATITDSRLNIDTLNLYSQDNNPLTVDGSIDFADLSRVSMDMNVKGRDFRLINSRETAKSEVYGTVFSDIDATVRGSLSSLFVYGSLNIKPNTNVNYVLKDSPLSAENDLNSLVTFTDFSDTATVEKKEESSGGVNMTMNIHIDDAAHLHCDINADGQSYLDVEGGGDLTFKYKPDGDMSLTGRYTIGSGEMKYALPVIPLRTFYLTGGSYIEFTGEPMNPTLSLAATERVKATVSDGDKPRSVNFDVGLRLTRPLSQMGLEFTIDAPDDQNVKNQLASMSEEQKNKLAVSMLATGLYLEESNTANGIKTSNALNAFLQNQVQQIAGKALKSVDLSLSVDNSTSSTGTSNTDYSFRFSKKFWGDRVNVIIGGHVSTGEDARNDASSFIDNVSLEYRLDRNAGRYVRMFYDRNSQDPLEGKLIEAGAGLVLRRKVEKFGEIFTLWKRSSKAGSGSNGKSSKEAAKKANAEAQDNRSKEINSKNGQQ